MDMLKLKERVSRIFLLLMLVMNMFAMSNNFLEEKFSSYTDPNRNSSSAYLNTITHEGDLVIRGTQTFVIENCIYMQKGNIFVLDQSTFKIQNAKLVLRMEYYDQYNIYVEDFAKIEVFNSEITVENWFTGLRLNGSSIGRVENSILNIGVWLCGKSNISIKNTDVPLIGFWESSTVYLDGSTVNDIILHFYYPLRAILQGLKPGHYTYWNLHLNQTVYNTDQDLTIRNSTVAFSVVLHDNAEVEVSNSEIECVRIYIWEPAVIHNARPGYLENWNFRSISLKNTTVRDQWFFSVQNTRLSIYNSITRIGIAGRSSICFTNCSVDSLVTYDNSFSKLFFFKYNIFTRYIQIVNSEVYMWGNTTFSLGYYTFHSSKVRRNFNIIVVDHSHNPLNQVKLQLFNENGSLLWEGSTDNSGKSTFVIAFTDNNHTQAFKLKAMKENYMDVETDINIFSATPIFLVMEEAKKLEGGGTRRLLK